MDNKDNVKTGPLRMQKRYTVSNKSIIKKNEKITKFNDDTNITHLQPTVVRRRSSSTPDSLNEFNIQRKKKKRSQSIKSYKDKIKKEKTFTFSNGTKSPEKVKLKKNETSKKSLRLFLKKNKSSPTTSQNSLKRIGIIQSIINHLCIRPIIKDINNNEESNYCEKDSDNLFMSTVLESFKRQKTFRFVKSASILRKEMVEVAFAEPKQVLSSKGGTPMGFGVMEINIDRWWNEINFKGTVYYNGILFQEYPVKICKLLLLLESSKDSDSIHEGCIKYLKEISGSCKSSNLDKFNNVSQFFDNDDISYISSGYSSIATVSSLGKLFIKVPLCEYTSCLGVSICPSDWNGSLYIEKILGRRIKIISCGPNHYAAITDTKEVILWGINIDSTSRQISGQLGNNHNHISTPILITGLFGDPTEVSCGLAHTAILTTEGLYTCGSNNHGQLGHATDDHPILVEGIVDKFNVSCRISSISCGAFHTIVSTQDGLVFSWGNNSCGQLGIDTAKLFIKIPTCIKELNMIVSVSAGDSHSIACNAHGNVYTWGSNLFGQLGLGDNIESLRIPSLVKICNNNKSEYIVTVSTGPFCTMVLSNWGIGYTWGMLQSIYHVSNQYIPRILEDPLEKNLFLVSISPGVTHSLFMTDNELTKTLDILKKACCFELPIGNNYLIQQIQKIENPKRLFGVLIERIYYILNKQSNIILPRIYTKDSYIQFSCKSRFKRIYEKKITIINPTDYRIWIDTIIPGNDPFYQIQVEPSCFRMGKNSSLEITISLITTRKVQKSFFKLIHFIIKKKDISKVNGNINSFQYFICCHIQKHCNIILEQDKPLQEHALKLINSLTTYVPNVLVEYFVKNPNVVQEPKIQEFPAAILFLDISGFTRLNEKLAELGSTGAEIVSKHINSYFSQIIQVVSIHGGDVLKFAGDALICMWKGSNESLEIHSIRAIQCGLDIQNKLDKYDSNEGFSLTLHIGMGAGNILSLWVGSVEDSWEYLVSGEPLAQLRTAVDNSKAGQVVVSSEAWNLIKHRCKGEQCFNDYLVTQVINTINIKALSLVKNWPRLDAEPALRCFIPLAVQVNIDSQHHVEWQNELRLVTILFVKLNTPIPDNDKDYFLQTINSLLCSMQEVIFKYHGMIRQFLADDKGTVLIAAFGVPPFSYEDDSLRGIKAAIDIYDKLSQLSMDCSIGITTGQVFCGQVGSHLRNEYAMVGDTVNLSARLMIAAYKQNIKILCDKRTFKNTYKYINFTKLPAIQVKGKKELIKIYSPNTNRKTNEFKISKRFKENRYLTHRINVLHILKNNIATILDSNIKEKGNLLIEAEQGMGKSIVINEIMRMAINNNILLCHSKLDAITQSDNLYEFQTLFSDLLNITNINESFILSNIYNCDKLLDTLKQLLDYTWYEMVPLLNDILPLNIQENETTLSIPQSHRTENLKSLLFHIIERKAKVEPIIFIIEDSQWLGNYSRSVIHDIACKIPSVFIICTSRLNVPDNNVLFSGTKNLQIIQLDPLSEHDSIQFVMSELNVDILPSEIIELISKAKGNPLLLSEIALTLNEAQILQITNRKCILKGNINDINLGRVTRILVSTLDRYSTFQQVILKVASIIGFSFQLDILTDVFPSGNTQKKFIKGELDVLTKLQVIKEINSQPGEESYSFTNPSFLDAIHERLTSAQLFELHLQLAELYELKSKNNLSHLPLLTYHWIEVIERIQEPQIDLIIKTLKYIKKVASISNKSKSWIWLQKGLFITKKLLPTDIKRQYIKEFQLQLIGCSQLKERSSDINESDLNIRELVIYP